MSPEDAQQRINALLRHSVPQCVIFSKYDFTAGSFGDTLCKSGALAFLEDKMRDFSLYKLCDSPLPSKANPSNEVIRELQECFKDVLSLCDELNDDSIELYSMRIMATQLLHYLSSGGVRAKDMQKDGNEEIQGRKMGAAVE